MDKVFNKFKKPEDILNEKIEEFNKLNNAELSVRANRSMGFNLYSGGGDALFNGSIEYIIGVVDGMQLMLEMKK